MRAGRGEAAGGRGLLGAPTVSQAGALVCRQLEVCLGEVESSQLFVGILGSRYGYVPTDYNLPEHPHFRWVRQAGAAGGFRGHGGASSEESLSVGQEARARHGVM